MQMIQGQDSSRVTNVDDMRVEIYHLTIFILHVLPVSDLNIHASENFFKTLIFSERLFLRDKIVT